LSAWGDIFCPTLSRQKIKNNTDSIGEDISYWKRWSPG
jgi:hypothetical protein